MKERFQVGRQNIFIKPAELKQKRLNLNASIRKDCGRVES